MSVPPFSSGNQALRAWSCRCDKFILQTFADCHGEPGTGTGHFETSVLSRVLEPLGTGHLERKDLGLIFMELTLAFGRKITKEFFQTDNC